MPRIMKEYSKEDIRQWILQALKKKYGDDNWTHIIGEFVGSSQILIDISFENLMKWLVDENDNIVFERFDNLIEMMEEKHFYPDIENIIGGEDKMRYLFSSDSTEYLIRLSSTPGMFTVMYYEFKDNTKKILNMRLKNLEQILAFKKK